MTAPAITLTGSSQSKTSGTTLSCTLTSTSYSVGDYVRVTFGSDPGTNTTVSFAKQIGSATLGAWTIMLDSASGSGTSGGRLVTARARVTAAGTVQTINATFPTAAAKSFEVYKVSGADATTPVVGFATNLVGLVPGTANANKDLLAIGASVYESATGTATFTSIDTGWTAVYTTETASFGTSGSGGSSNISVATFSEKVEPLATINANNNIAPWDTSAAPAVNGGEIWQPTVVIASVVVSPTVINYGAIQRASRW